MQTEFHFNYYYDKARRIRHRTIYLKYYPNEKILEIHCDGGVPKEWFMTIKNRFHKKVENGEMRVV